MKELLTKARNLNCCPRKVPRCWGAAGHLSSPSSTLDLHKSSVDPFLAQSDLQAYIAHSIDTLAFQPWRTLHVLTRWWEHGPECRVAGLVEVVLDRTNQYIAVWESLSIQRITRGASIRTTPTVWTKSPKSPKILRNISARNVCSLEIASCYYSSILL